MEGKHGIVIGAALIALAGIGVALIMAIGVPQQNPTAIPGATAPVEDPNAVGSLPPQTSTAGDATTGNSTANHSQSDMLSGGAAGGMYGGP